MCPKACASFLTYAPAQMNEGKVWFGGVRWIRPGLSPLQNEHESLEMRTIGGRIVVTSAMAVMQLSALLDVLEIILKIIGFASALQLLGWLRRPKPTRPKPLNLKAPNPKPQRPKPYVNRKALETENPIHPKTSRSPSFRLETLL